MNRVIKFRGKVDGAWWYTTPESANWGVFWRDVDPETVGQYIGLTDKHVNEIYESDIVEIEGATAHVVFWEKPPEFGLNFYHNEDAWCEDWNLSDDSERMEIIGNIYEHKELLEAK